MLRAATMPEGLGSVVLASASLLLILSGVGKVRRPTATARVLQKVGFPAPGRLAQLLGFVELSFGIAGLLVPSPFVAAAVSLLYLTFAAFLGLALVRRLPIEDCGCAGSKFAIPPSWLHVGLDVAIGLTSLLATAPVISVFELVRADPAVGLLVVAGCLILCGEIVAAARFAGIRTQSVWGGGTR